MPKHCSAHTHYVPDCTPCKGAYALFKSQTGAKPPTVGTLLTNLNKPGKPLEIMGEGENISMEYLAATAPGEVTTAAPVYSELQLDTLSVQELRKLCSANGITRIGQIPVSNCKREQLLAALQGQPQPGQGNGEGSPLDSAEAQGTQCQDYGPQPGKAPSQQLPEGAIKAMARDILKSKEFEDATLRSDALGLVRQDMIVTRIGVQTVATHFSAEVAALKQAVASVSQQGPATVSITVQTTPSLPAPEVSGDIPNSPTLKRIIEHLANREHVALIGPAGCGKSTLVRIACDALSAKLYHTPCGGDIREQHLLGRTIPVKGEWTYIPAPFVIGFESEENAVVLLDEMDGVSDPSVLLPINDVLAGFGHLHLPWRWEKPVADRGKGFLGVCATMNTVGNGATTIYQGRTALDGSTLDRFVGRIIEVDYDNAYEEAFIKGPEGSPVTPNGTDWLAWVRETRSIVAKNGLRRIISTRMLQQGANMLRRGWKLNDVKKAMVTGWSISDTNMVKVA